MNILEISDLKINSDCCPNIDLIVINNISDVTYKSFFKDIILKNIPCVIKNVSSNWNCKQWVTKDGLIDYEYIKSVYGHLEAPVSDCNQVTFDSQCKSSMKVFDYINYINSDSRDSLLYLKDWHLRKLMPNDCFYEVPNIFGSDWLNEYALDNNDDDFMFVYIGPSNSWTALHADVYNSYSWSVNVIGEKKWILLYPGEEDKIKDSFGNIPLHIEQTKLLELKHIEIVQKEGDAIFVPSGWHHTVINLKDTISINHNWVNACNILSVWLNLEKTLLSVKNEIQDLKDDPEYGKQCQLILKSLFGMDINSFINFLSFIAEKRLNQMEGKVYTVFNQYQLGSNHIIFDIQKILEVINFMEKHIVNDSKYTEQYESELKLLHNLNNKIRIKKDEIFSS